jgi:AraC family transcriptional regulator
VRPSTRDILELLDRVNCRSTQATTLADMADLSHRSPWSLHRLFRRVTGETPKRYELRVRLDRAASTHASTVESVSPCIGLFHMPVNERTHPVSVEIEVKDLPAITALVVERRTSREGIAAALAECLPMVFDYAMREGLAIAGRPFARYTTVGLATLVIESGVAIAEPPPNPPDGEITVLEIPAGPTAITLHRGPYERLHETYLAVEAWMDEHGFAAAGPSWEVYLTDPGEHPDPETWETEINQPVRPA